MNVIADVLRFAFGLPLPRSTWLETVKTAALLTVNTVGALETLLSFASAAKPGPMPGRYLEYLNKSDSVPLSLRATRAAVIREAAFKCSGLAGLPRVRSACCISSYNRALSSKSFVSDD